MFVAAITTSTMYRHLVDKESEDNVQTLGSTAQNKTTKNCGTVVFE